MIRILLFAFFSGLLAQAKPNITFEKTVRYQDEIAGKSIEILIRQGVYDFSTHKISGGANLPVDDPLKESQPAKVDGVEFAGTDGTNPFVGRNRTEMLMETVTEITLIWDGKKIEIPKQLHINLLCLSLADDFGWETIQFLPNSVGDSMLIQATGGDGGGGYLVSLILRKDGKHKQIYHGYWEDELPSEREAWELVEAEQDVPPKSDRAGG